MRVITILFVLLITSVVQAGVLPLKIRFKDCKQNSCTVLTGYGTCALIAKHQGKSVYLTAAHNLEGVITSYVGFNGKWHTAHLVGWKWNGNIDIAIIETDEQPPVGCVEISDRAPTVGDSAYLYGYPGKSDVSIRKDGRIVSDQGELMFSTQAQLGDSGGPLIVDGKLVGIIRSYTPKTQNANPYKPEYYTRYTGREDIYVCLKRFYNMIPRCSSRTVVAVVPSQPIQPKPDPLFYQPIDNSGDLEALQGEVSKLRAQIDALAKTQIPVQIIGADGKMVTEQKYPLGDPIKLRFKAVKK